MHGNPKDKIQKTGASVAIAHQHHAPDLIPTDWFFNESTAGG
jgi:hypothetical protein